MKVVNKSQFQSVLSGSNLLGTGGGGTVITASRIMQKMKKPVKIVSLFQLDRNDLVCTVFGIGGKQICDPIIAAKKAFSIFQSINNQKISAIIPVEVGPMAIATACFIASEINVPILDSDIVGLRSSPEVFLETISIKNIRRTPIVISDDKGNSAILWESRDISFMEKFFRNFAISAGGDAFIVGYPLKIKDIKNIVPKDSISFSLITGDMLIRLKKRKISLDEFCESLEWTLLGVGKIIEVKKDTSKGFSQGKYIIESNRNRFTILFKNENIVCLINGSVVLTCPDSISLLDNDSFEAINNFEDNEGRSVAILGRKAIQIWRSEKGKELFSPKNLGFNLQQKLL